MRATYAVLRSDLHWAELEVRVCRAVLQVCRLRSLRTYLAGGLARCRFADMKAADRREPGEAVSFFRQNVRATYRIAHNGFTSLRRRTARLAGRACRCATGRISDGDSDEKSNTALTGAAVMPGINDLYGPSARSPPPSDVSFSHSSLSLPKTACHEQAQKFSDASHHC